MTRHFSLEKRIVKKAFKRRFYPTTEQADLLARSFGCKRFVYNNSKAFKDDAYKAGGTNVSSHVLVTRLVLLKKEY
ncbi:helix-turn-helix domain-containing protein [Pseudoalteromonas sp. MIP2626]|uniref:helix-turn-helix domain-containing protein n=1 Tax=Pseudoalteromonas sp. MIP2626 TaxID=2705464 RepID=UPI0031F958D1